MTNNWMFKVLVQTCKSLPHKYFNGTYIENRACSDEFTDDDIDQNFYYLGDILPDQISCKWKDTGKKYVMSVGECTTITMIERSIELASETDVVHILLMAYFHDMDSILSSCLSGKIIGKLHRRTTSMIKSWKNGNADVIGFWNGRCKKYLLLSDEDIECINTHMMSLDQETLVRMFDSDDVSLFVEHFCKVIELAFDTKKTFHSKHFHLMLVRQRWIILSASMAYGDGGFMPLLPKARAASLIKNLSQE